MERDEPPPGSPRVGLFLCEAANPALLRATLERIPRALDPALQEVVVMLGPGAPSALAEPRELAPDRGFELRLHRSPRDQGYGSVRKAALEHAVRRRFDHAIVMRADGTHPPEALPSLLAEAVSGPERLVLGSRLVQRTESWRAGMSLRRLVAYALVTGLQNRMLGLRLHDYHTGFRVYPVRALQCIPFQLNAAERAFDAEILLQFRALGVPVHEVSVLPAWREEAGARSELGLVLRACGAALGYRLHQLHATRDGRYLLDRGARYTFKRSPASSHMQITAAVRSGSRVLDLGCSQGLLARPLRDKGVRVTGVDVDPRERTPPEFEAYHQRDLEGPLALPEGRVFDYVVIADVIEHLRNRQQLLRAARRHLVGNGRLIVSTPNVALWFYRLSLLVGRFEYGPRGILDRTHVHLYTRATIRRELERAGFHVIEEGATGLPFEVVFESTGRSRSLRAIDRAYWALARWWPELFAYQLVLEAELTTLDDEAAAEG
jgi:2-polyprenyl-3-methyl-5-hydroxy-6-metoxy-1,4-benzoquinol methylase